MRSHKKEKRGGKAFMGRGGRVGVRRVEKNSEIIKKKGKKKA